MKDTATPANSSFPSLEYVASCALPTPWATFELHGFLDRSTGKEHLALTLGNVAGVEPLLARVHSECLTGDALFSQRCDCGAQLQAALQRIAQHGRGVLLYLRQEGRGIGLLNKIRAYRLQQTGADTVEANHRLGFADDLRDYGLCKLMLDYLGIRCLRLMTNNPRKLRALLQLGIQVEERIPLVINHNPFNQDYLKTKAARLGHWIPANDPEAPQSSAAAPAA